MSKQKQSNNRLKVFGQLSIAAFMVSVMLFSSVAPQLAQADEFDQKIQALREQNKENKQELEDLALQADDLQTTISKLQRQVNELEAKISANQKKRDLLKKEIKKAERELAEQKDLLSQNIRAIYLEGDITTLEMLASSPDLSEFLDKQEYRNVIQDRIKSTLDQINLLKAKLAKQKKDTENLIAEDSALQKEVASQRAEQSRLLGLNKSEQASFNNKIANNREKIEELRQQQIIANLAMFGGGVQPGVAGGGGYPWGNAYCVHTGNVGGSCFNYDWYFNGGAWDSWGYGFRNCTSWVAFKLAAAGKTGISNLGNAAQWPGNAKARGHKVSYGSGARVGDAAVNPNGYYGHVMYVEAVSGNKVVVSDYNRAGDGLYRGPDSGNANVLNQSGLVFIHF